MSVFTNPASSSKEQAQEYTRAVLGLAEGLNPLDVLYGTPAVARKAVEGMSPRAMFTPEAAGKWSVRQVLRHLVDSEIVWSWRLRLVLAQDRPVLTGYDQDAWAERLHYAAADPEESLQEFAVLRRGNLRLLEQAGPDDLRRVGVHSERGEESVEHLIRLYAGHDILHLRQLERIRAAVGG
jgi:uncharacterized damage-inducible protein DinB